MNSPGEAENLARHFWLQKYQVRPWCSRVPPLGALGFTSMPQTGSIANQRSGSARKRPRHPWLQKK